MDAFHIGHRVLERRGLTGVKGAPETFDAVGFIHLLQRIRTERGPIYAPEFAREIEDSLAHVIEIDAQVRLVIVEGNYLLLDTPAVERRTTDARRSLVRAPGRRRAAAADDAPARAFRLRPGDRRARTLGTDERNAQLVNAAPNRPDLWIEQSFGTN